MVSRCSKNDSKTIPKCSQNFIKIDTKKDSEKVENILTKLIGNDDKNDDKNLSKKHKFAKL